MGLPSEDDVDHEVTSRQDWLDRFIGLISDSSAGVDIDGYSRPESVKERRRRYITLFVCAILTCVALIGASRLRVWHNPLSWLPSDEPTAETFAIVDKEVGGTANIQLLIKGGEQGMRDLELLKGVEALKSHIMSYQHPEHGDIIRNVININDIVKETRRALYNGDDSEYRLPETRQELSQLLFAREFWLLLRPSSLSSLEYKKSDGDDENAFPLTVFPKLVLLLFRKATVSLPLTRPLLLLLPTETESLVVVVWIVVVAIVVIVMFFVVLSHYYF